MLRVAFLLLAAVWGLAGIGALRQRAGRSRTDPFRLPRVRPVNDGGMYLEVTNTDERAAFEARIEVVSGREGLHQIDSPVRFDGYAGVWQSNRRDQTTLGAGQKDRLLIGRVEPAPPGLPRASVFKLAYYDDTGHRPAEYGTTGWIEGVRGIVPPQLELRVTISSSATPQRYVNTYFIDGDDNRHLREAKPFREFAGIIVRHY